MRVMCIFGTRPEAIKMAPVVKALQKDDQMDCIVCVTAQHREMLDQVLRVFDISPDYDLNIMEPGQSLSGITTKALQGIEGVIIEAKPDIILVHGDTTTTFAGALAAYYQKIPVGHVEAGLRTFDKYQPWPEEMNRKLTGSIADFHFAPTTTAEKHLLQEYVKPEDIYVTGNTAIDALSTTINDDYKFTIDLLNSIDYKNKKVVAMTAHRRENLGEPLENVCEAVLQLVNENEEVEVVYAVHLNPLVQQTAAKILGGHDRIHLLDPLDLEDMHNLMARSYLVLTDSGGLQEEVPSLGKPVLVVREVTERPEGVEAGTLKLVGTDTATIVEAGNTLFRDTSAYEAMSGAKNPYGDGHAAERIVKILRESKLAKSTLA